MLTDSAHFNRSLITNSTNVTDVSPTPPPWVASQVSHQHLRVHCSSPRLASCRCVRVRVRVFAYVAGLLQLIQTILMQYVESQEELKGLTHTHTHTHTHAVCRVAGRLKRVAGMVQPQSYHGHCPGAALRVPRSASGIYKL